jgi:hypothetical protein
VHGRLLIHPTAGAVRIPITISTPSDDEAKALLLSTPVDNYVDSRHRFIRRPSTDDKGVSRR